MNRVTSRPDPYWEIRDKEQYLLCMYAHEMLLRVPAARRRSFLIGLIEQAEDELDPAYY